MKQNNLMTQTVTHCYIVEKFLPVFQLLNDWKFSLFFFIFNHFDFWILFFGNQQLFVGGEIFSYSWVFVLNCTFWLTFSMVMKMMNLVKMV